MITNTGKRIKIGGVAKMLGISTRTIRYYEELDLTGVSKRLSGGARYYTGNDVVRLKFILKLKELGLSLKDMHELANNYELNNQDSGKTMPKLLELLDFHFGKVDRKLNSLSVLRKDIVDYQARIEILLK